MALSARAPARSRRALVLVMISALLLALAPFGVRTTDAAAFTVNSTLDAPDANPGDGLCATAAGTCTLRAAIQETNPLGGANTITLPAGTYLLTIGGRNEENAATGGNTDGGGVYTCCGNEVFTIQQSTIANNTAAGPGGGVNSEGTIPLINSTVSGNKAGTEGGGVHSDGTGVTLLNVTVTNHTADSDANGTGNGGGIARSSGTITLTNTIVAGNTDTGGQAPDCSGALVSGGFNLIGNATGCTPSAGPSDKVGTAASPINPQLGLLAENGGPTRTHLLLTGSPALDAITTGCPPPATDQRGITRPQGPRCDMGAVGGASVLTTPTATAVVNTTPTPTVTPGDP